MNGKDLNLAAQAEREYLTSRMGTKTGTISDFSHQKAKRATAN
ncbi:MAG: hypothetical protein ACLQVJ_20220 [Syntrophobacteraceae bacterium]